MKSAPNPNERASPAVAPRATYYPQSLWFEQQLEEVDNDQITSELLYRLPAHKRLEVGKYVPDPNNEDFSNPKYKPKADSAKASRSNSVKPRSSSKARQASYSDVETSFDSGSDVAPQVSSRKSSTVKMTFPVVEPKYSFSSASLFFPISYGRPSIKDKKDPRGLPQNINEEMHPNDRCHFQLSSVTCQKDNLNRMCLYKIGPGAVAFKVVMNAFEAAGLKYTSSNELFNILWAKRATPYTLASLNPYQKVNHFPGTWGIGRKDCLAQNVGKMKRFFGEDVFDIIPTSFLIPRQKAELVRDAEKNPGTEENPLIYIVKPSASSCGRGIYLHKGVPPMPTGTKQMVCQRYIGNPLLIFGRKFDLRLYCLVTSFDPLRIYLFDEGLVRFAAEKYPGPDKALENIHMHLTNYSVNKTAELSKTSKGKDFDGEDAVDIKWCISDFKRYLEKNHPLGKSAWETIQAECDDVVTKAFLSIEHDVIEKLRSECKDKTGRCCFEMFGLDLMVDENLKVRLIEVNIMPSLATGSTLDKAVKGRMLAHLLTAIRPIPFNRPKLTAALADTANKETFLPSGAGPNTPERTYKFGKHPNASARAIEKPLLDKFDDPNDPHSMRSEEEKLMCIEAEEELRCSGGFRRVYPQPDTVKNYLQYFTHGVSRNNYIMASAVCMAENKEEN